jgi:phage tail protein X
VERLARTIRLVTGLGMVAAGTSLAAPAAIELHRWWQLMSQPTAVTFWPVAEAAPAVAASAGPRTELPAAGLLPGTQAVEPLQPDRDYVLPPPPAPLPPVASTGPQPAETLAAAYRSTLDVPPPPLLDGQQPPPLATGWSGRQPEPTGHRPATSTPQAMVYVIRDGDDLTGIATRFYGHPAAAAAIWDANRGLLRDPGILPIGATILLPHPDLVSGLVQAGPRLPTIEPAGSPGAIRAVGQRLP